jgi:hypothetical protein
MSFTGRASSPGTLAWFVVLEYVWTEWMRCNQVILLRDLLRGAVKNG